MRLLKQDFTLGAIYRIGAARGFDSATLVRLMVDRAKMPQRAAEQLAAHWITTEPFRRNT